MSIDSMTANEFLLLFESEGLSQRKFAKKHNCSLGKVQRKLAKAANSGTVMKPGITFKEDGNYATVESISERIISVEQLLKAAHVDLDVWGYDDPVLNKWEIGRKHIEKDIQYEENKKSGFDRDDGTVFVEPLFQVKVHLYRLRPIAMKPVIRPININVNYTKPSYKRHGMKCALVVPDTQFGFARNVISGELTPFHDRLAIDIAFQIAQVVNPDVTGFLGDINDFSGWSDKFVRRPEFAFTTQPALVEAAWVIAKMNSLSGETFALEGNHEKRVDTILVTHMVDAYELHSADQLSGLPILSIDNLLGLSRMGVQYIGDYPSGTYWLNETTRFIHGDKVRGPGLTSVDLVKQSNETVIYGHIHRRELTSRTIWGRNGNRTVTAFSPGCLCHIDGRVPGGKRGDQWQQGLAVIWYDEERSQIIPIEIDNGKAVYGGALFTATDYTEEMMRDTGWPFS